MGEGPKKKRYEPPVIVGADPAAPFMPTTVTLVGFPCLVMEPMARSHGDPGIKLGIGHDPLNGPRFVYSIAHPDTRTLTAVLTRQQLPGLIELFSRQATAFLAAAQAFEVQKGTPQ